MLFIHAIFILYQYLQTHMGNENINYCVRLIEHELLLINYHSYFIDHLFIHSHTI